MTKERFDEFVRELLDEIDAKLTCKGKEYNLEEDRLGFFKRAAGLGGTPEKALFGFMLKHIVSVSDMVAYERYFEMSVWKEKLIDIMDYCALLLALEEEKEKEEAKI